MLYKQFIRQYLFIVKLKHLLCEWLINTVSGNSPVHSIEVDCLSVQYAKIGQLKFTPPPELPLTAAHCILSIHPMT